MKTFSKSELGELRAVVQMMPPTKAALLVEQIAGNMAPEMVRAMVEMVAQLTHDPAQFVEAAQHDPELQAAVRVFGRRLSLLTLDALRS